jgi:hypothetical protein
MTIESFREERFADSFRLGLALFGKSRTQPGRSVAFDDEGAHLRRIAVMVSVKRPKFAFNENLRQGRECFCCSIPDELAVEIGKRSPEVPFKPAAYE